MSSASIKLLVIVSIFARLTAVESQHKIWLKKKITKDNFKQMQEDNLRPIVEYFKSLLFPDSQENSLKPCNFSVEILTELTGVCTRYGSCRIHNLDYMYQVRQQPRNF